jgi:hypothetical protein
MFFLMLLYDAELADDFGEDDGLSRDALRVPSRVAIERRRRRRRLEPCTGRAARGPGRAGPGLSEARAGPGRAGPLSLIWPKIKDDIIELHNGHLTC